VGDPPMNLVAGAVTEEAGRLRFRHTAFSVPLPFDLAARLPRAGARDDVVLGLRPYQIGVDDGPRAVRGDVWVWEPLGKYGILTVRLGPDMVKAKIANTRRWTPGDAVSLDLSAAEPVLFDGATGVAC
jgi:ABC-type sugar transport system ATPase subunit